MDTITYPKKFPKHKRISILNINKKTNLSCVSKVSCIDPKCNDKYCNHQIKTICEEPKHTLYSVFKRIGSTVVHHSFGVNILMFISLLCSIMIFPLPTVLSMHYGRQFFQWSFRKIQNKIFQFKKSLYSQRIKNYRKVRRKKVFSKRSFKVKNKYMPKINSVQIGGKNGEQILFECKICDKGTLFEMDSGACVSIISLDILTVLDKNFHYEK